MIINNKEIKFKRTVGASCAIADLCEDGTLDNFEKLFVGPQSKIVKAKAQIIKALNDGYVDHCAFFEDSKKDRISVDEVLALPTEDFIQLWDEAYAELFFSESSKTTVETEPSKKEEEEGTGK